MTKTEEELAEMQVAREKLPVLTKELKRLHPRDDAILYREKKDEIVLNRMIAAGKKAVGERVVAKQIEGGLKSAAAKSHKHRAEN
jgi:hypothetical protein